MATCIYCGVGPRECKDHVPQEALFDVMPKQATTVPICKTCEKGIGHDDEDVRNLFISLEETEDHPVAKKLAKVRDRSYRQRRAFEANVRLLKRVQPVSPAGVVLPQRWAYDLAIPLVDRFMTRVARAMLYHCQKKLHSIHRDKPNRPTYGYVDCSVQWLKVHQSLAEFDRPQFTWCSRDVFEFDGWFLGRAFIFETTFYGGLQFRTMVLPWPHKPSE